MFASVLISLALLAQSALATIYVTSPVASTTWQAGTQQTISWEDDGQGVTLQQFSNTKVSMGVGNAISQTSLQTITPSVDVSTTASIVFTPDPTVGGSGNFYFIRFESLAFKDPTQPQFPALGFSAKFTLNGMTGSFNASVQSEINGASTAPLGAPASTSAASSPASTTSASITKTTSSSASATKSSAAPSHSGSASGASSGASGLAVNSAIAILGSIAAIFTMML